MNENEIRKLLIDKRSEIRELENEIRRVNHEIYKIKLQHKHRIVKDLMTAVCEICGERFKWWCPESPDHICYYFSTDGEVELIDGTTVKKSSPNENLDECLFCGKPEERK